MKIQLARKKFGKWTVLSYAENSNWNCICKCGNKRVVQGNDLRNGHSKQCAECNKSNLKNKYIDITKKKYGKLTVVKYAGESMWECKCDCGNNHTAGTSDLKDLRVNQCKKCCSAQRAETKTVKHNVFGKYLSVAEMSKIAGVGVNTVAWRIRKYGNEWDKIICPKRKSGPASNKRA